MCKRCDEEQAVEDYTITLLDLARELGIPAALGARAMARAAGVLASESGYPGVPVGDMLAWRARRDERAVGRD